MITKQDYKRTIKFMIWQVKSNEVFWPWIIAGLLLLPFIVITNKKTQVQSAKSWFLMFLHDPGFSDCPYTDLRALIYANSHNCYLLARKF